MQSEDKVAGRLLRLEHAGLTENIHPLWFPCIILAYQGVGGGCLILVESSIIIQSIINSLAIFSLWGQLF